MESHGHDQHRIISPNYLTVTMTILIWEVLICPALEKSGLCQSTQHLPSFWEPETCFPSHFTSVSTAMSRISQNQAFDLGLHSAPVGLTPAGMELEPISSQASQVWPMCSACVPSTVAAIQSPLVCYDCREMNPSGVPVTAILTVIPERHDEAMLTFQPRPPGR